MTRITGTLHEDQQTFFIISHSVLLRMRNFSEKSCRQTKNTHFVFNHFVFFFESRFVYEIMWKNILEPGRPQMTIWRMCIACWVSKATSRHSEYVIIIALTLQQLSHERISVLRYTYIACLVDENQVISEEGVGVEGHPVLSYPVLVQYTETKVIEDLFMC